MKKSVAARSLTIGTKLNALIALVLLSSIVSLVWLSTRMFIEDNTALIQQMNANTANSLAAQMRELFGSVNGKARMLGATLLAQTNPDPAVLKEFFAEDRDLLGVYIHLHSVDGSKAGPKLLAKAFSEDMTALGEADGARTLAALLAEKDFSLGQLAKGETQVATINLSDGSAVVALGIPLLEAGGGFSHTLITLIRQSRFLSLFNDNELATSFMVDHKGKLLAHADLARVTARENVGSLGIVKQLLEGFNNGQTRYIDPQSGEARLGAFKIVGFGGLGVVSEVAESKAFEAAWKVRFRSSLIAFVVLCLAFLTGYLFSGTITSPLKQLTEAAGRIAEGDFKINLIPRGRDELATLSLTFNKMAVGLIERDRVKETFNKFHNKEIADKLLSGEVKLGGERRDATIFFSDVRGFTGLSESMEPEQVVEMLNEYMTRMVSIIRAHHGIVDKYVGDAIMAIWGVPIGRPDDTYNAVRACIEMRSELEKLNAARLARGQVALKIGMGLNRGPVIAGNIGSNEKMEYTVIGDSVNLASRMESMTKEYGSDFLVSKNVYEPVAERFIFEQVESAYVKGKTAPIEVFKVLGYFRENGERVIVETPYSSYQAEKSDKVVHPEPREQVAPPPFRQSAA
ncbi:MAG: HAMP domain-containing protein [Methylotenera sp.]|nr:HAMP domain-containing protein [Oligoflexia bacterium]